MLLIKRNKLDYVLLRKITKFMLSARHLIGRLGPEYAMKIKYDGHMIPRDSPKLLQKGSAKIQQFEQ